MGCPGKACAALTPFGARARNADKKTRCVIGFNSLGGRRTAAIEGRSQACLACQSRNGRFHSSCAGKRLPCWNQSEPALAFLRPLTLANFVRGLIRQITATTARPAEHPQPLPFPDDTWSLLKIILRHRVSEPCTRAASSWSITQSSVKESGCSG